MADPKIQISVDLKTRLAQQYSRIAGRVKNQSARIKQAIQSVGPAADKSFNQVTSAAGKMSTSIKNFAAQFGPAAAAVAALSFAVRGLGKAVDFVRTRTEAFQASMSKIRAIVQPTAAGFDQLTAKAKQLGETTAFSASEAAEAFTELGKLGFETNQIIASSAEILNLAAVAQTDMATAASVTAETLNSYGLNAEDAGRVTDVMGKSFSRSALDMTKFSESMKFAAPVAGDLGLSIEETTAMLETLANAGIHGSMAGTGLRRVMLLLADETSAAGKIIGLTANDTRTFTERLQALQSKNLSPAQIKATFGLLGTTAASILSKGTESIINYTAENEKAAGSLQKMADIMLDNVAGATKILESAQEGLGLAIGEAFGAAKQRRIEFYTRLITWLKDAVLANQQQFREFGERVSEVLKTFAELGAKVLIRVINNFDKLVGIAKVIIAVLSQKALFAMVGGIKALGMAFTSAATRGLAFKNLLIGLQQVGIMAFLVGLQIALDKILESMEAVNEARNNIDWTEDIQFLEKALELRQAYEQNEIRIAALRQKGIVYGSQEEKRLNELIIKNAELNDQFKERTGFNFSETIARSSGVLQEQIRLIKERQAADKEAADKAISNAERVKKTKIDGGDITQPGGGSTTDEDAKTQERAEKALAAAADLQNRLEVQRLEGLEREKLQLQMWYAEQAQILLEGGESLASLDEIRDKKRAAIHKKYMDQITQQAKDQSAAEIAIQRQKLSAISGIMGEFAGVLEYAATKNKQFAGVFKAVAIGETIINTYMAAQKAYNSLAGIPVVGPGLGAAAAAAAVASGLVRVAKIKEQKFQSGGFSGSRDTVPARITPDEVVLNSQQQRNFMAMANGMTGQRGAPENININITAPGGDPTVIRDAVSDAINDTYQERVQRFSEMELEVDTLNVGNA